MQKEEAPGCKACVLGSAGCPASTSTELRKVLDHGTVRLEASQATDLSVVNSARVSFLKHKELVDEGDEKLIAFLLRGRHGTPFEHNSFTFVVQAPIFVAREWMRHRIGSYNEHSLRYSEAIDKFYLPELEDMRTQVGRPGHYTFESMEPTTAEVHQQMMREVYDNAWMVYNYMIGEGVAKEVARMVLPVSIYTQFYWTVNARSLMNFLSLRNSEFAQREIRMYAEAIEEIFAEKMPITYRSFVDNGRVAP